MLKDSRFTEIDEEFVCENCGKRYQNLAIHAEIIAHIVCIQNM